MGRDYILTVFVTMFTVIDPIGLVPFYIPIANKLPANKRRRLVFYSCTIAFIVSISFLFVGKYLFKYLGIEFDALYIVGGILIFLIGLDMIYARPKRVNVAQEDENETISRITDLAVFPLAIPMLAGPGTLAALIMFSSKYNTLENYLLVLFATLVTFVIAALTMTFSAALERAFGKIGINVLERVIGLVLCCLAAQFVINAIVNIAAFKQTIIH